MEREEYRSFRMWRANLHGEWESSPPSIERYAIARMLGADAELAKSCISEENRKT